MKKKKSMLNLALSLLIYIICNIKLVFILTLVIIFYYNSIIFRTKINKLLFSVYLLIRRFPLFTLYFLLYLFAYVVFIIKFETINSFWIHLNKTPLWNKVMGSLYDYFLKIDDETILEIQNLEIFELPSIDEIDFPILIDDPYYYPYISEILESGNSFDYWSNFTIGIFIMIVVIITFIIINKYK